jgi:signal transduction histidine kinase
MKTIDGRQPRILIADDTQKNVQVIGTVLRREGYQINVASNGKQAIELASKITPDLVLLDIMMPGGDGIETCKILKGMEGLKKVPILFISAKSELEDVLKGFRVGGSDYIAKPFNVQELVARVNTHLENKLYRELIEQQNFEHKELLHILCHDLTNPIVGIMGILELLEEVTTFEEAKNFFKYLNIGARNAYEIIELIRKMQVIEEKKMSLELERLNLFDLFEESMNIIHIRAKDKKISVKREIDKKHFVIVDKTSFINSVLNNLLTNSIKFSKPGSRIEVTSHLEDNNIVLKVKDYGIGMNEDHLETLFNVSKVISRRGTEGEKGTGYGMPLIQKFVHEYGGDISVSSSEDEQDHGTEVRIVLKLGQK